MGNLAGIKIFDTLLDLQRAAAEVITRLLIEATESGNEFSFALSGGSTPRGVFTHLAQKALQPLSWERTHFFWGDERHVPPGHPDSNFRMANESLLSRIAVPPGNVHRMRSELDDPSQTAELYEEELRTYFQLNARGWPAFDLVLLGMGPDGHTASLFPGTQALNEAERLVVANWVGKIDAWRITVTAPVINRAARVIILVAGEEKAPVLNAALRGPREPAQLPIQLVQPISGALTWMVDRAAAERLPESLNSHK